MTFTGYRHRQHGLVLILALLILLATALLASTLFETNLMQMRMAGNEQARAQALQGALSVVDAVLEDHANFPLHGQVGDRFCPAGTADSNCDAVLAALDPRAVGTQAVLGYFLTRKGPLELALPVMAEGRASSGRHYRAALFEVTSAARTVGARVSVSQGILVRLVARHQLGSLP